MRIEKQMLNDALRVLGKVVYQTSPVELYRSVRFVGDENGIRAMATDGVETVFVAVDAFTDTEIDFCVPFKELKDLVRIGRSETMEKFTLKISKELRCYELDEEKRMLHITVQKRRRSNTAEKI